jgi:hypothetical protein
VDEIRPLSGEEIAAIRSRMDVWSDYGPDPTATILGLIATIERIGAGHTFCDEDDCSVAMEFNRMGYRVAAG